MKLPASLVPLLLLLHAAACSSRPPAGFPGPRALSLETAHFARETDLEEQLARVILTRAESCHREMTGWFEVPEPAPRVHLLLFADLNAYAHYTGEGASTGPRGLFRPPPPAGRAEIALPPVSFLEPVIRHELGHVFLRRLLRDPPVWLDEGVAEYCVSLIHPELLEDSLRRVQRDVAEGTAIPLPALLAMSHEEFYARGEPAYAAAHVFVAYLCGAAGCRIADPEGLAASAERVAGRQDWKAILAAA